MKQKESVDVAVVNRMADLDRAARLKHQRAEKLKDRRDMRAMLIERRAQLDAKIEGVEAQIKELTKSQAQTHAHRGLEPLTPKP